MKSNGLIIYIDGSAQPNPGQGGSAAVVYDTNMNVLAEYTKYFPHITNNRAELSALLLALQHINKDQLENIKAIYSDSKYLVDGYNIWHKSWRLSDNTYIKTNKQIVLNSDLWLRVLSYKSLNIIWVKAHSNNVYNNYVDLLAKSCL